MKKHCLLLAIFSMSLFITNAQDSSASKNKFQYYLEPYLMFPNLKGTVGLGNLPEASVNLTPGDVFSHLQIGAMLYFEAHNNTWAFSSDVLYMNLKQDILRNLNIISGNTNVKQLGWELAGLYKINPFLEIGAGLRLNNINSTLNLTLNTQGGISDSRTIVKTWIDPIIITRVKVPVTTKWLLQLRTDIGGFGIGSKFAWQAQFNAGYQFSKSFASSVGYRVIGVDYDKGNGSDRFLYDVNTFGPVIRFGFSF